MLTSTSQIGAAAPFHSYQLPQNLNFLNYQNKLNLLNSYTQLPPTSQIINPRSNSSTSTTPSPSSSTTSSSSNSTCPNYYPYLLNNSQLYSNLALNKSVNSYPQKSQIQFSNPYFSTTTPRYNMTYLPATASQYNFSTASSSPSFLTTTMNGLVKRKRRYKKPPELRKVLPKNSLMLLHEFRPNIEYRFLCQSGPIHRPLFTMCVDINEHKFEGTGKTKKEARMQAAEKALEFLVLHPEYIQKATTPATAIINTESSIASNSEEDLEDEGILAGDLGENSAKRLKSDFIETSCNLKNELKVV